MRYLSCFKTKPFLFIAGLMLGGLIILGARFVTYQPNQIHYHANFAVYINGLREQFKNPVYYQEVSVCSATNGITLPTQRAHMHDNINSLIHVHDHAVTWGQFFENLGWYLGPNFIQDRQQHLYVENGNNKLNLMLNGQDYTDLTPLTNVVIRDQDRLLVSFGAISGSTLTSEFNSVPATAHHYDVTKDPASCAGSEKVTISDRLKHLF